MYALSQLKENKKCVVFKIDDSLDINFKRRLYQIGIVRSAKITLEKRSIFKKSLLIHFNQMQMTLQKEIADLIFVRLTDE